MVFAAFPKFVQIVVFVQMYAPGSHIKVKETGITPEYLKNAPKAILFLEASMRGSLKMFWEDKLKSMITCPTYRG